MHCQKDCTCILCKELHNFKPNDKKKGMPATNFILKRTAAFRQRVPTPPLPPPNNNNNTSAANTKELILNHNNAANNHHQQSQRIITDIYAVPYKSKKGAKNFHHNNSTGDGCDNIYESIRSIKNRQKKLFSSHENLNDSNTTKTDDYNKSASQANLAVCFNEMRLMKKLDRTISASAVDTTLDVKPTPGPPVSSPGATPPQTTDSKNIHKSVIYVSDSWRKNPKMETLKATTNRVNSDARNEVDPKEWITTTTTTTSSSGKGNDGKVVSSVTISPANTTVNLKKESIETSQKEQQFFTIELNNNNLCNSNNNSNNSTPLKNVTTVVDSATQVSLARHAGTTTVNNNNPEQDNNGKREAIDAVTVLAEMVNTTDGGGQKVINVLYRDSFKYATDIIDSLATVNFVELCAESEQLFDGNDMFPVEVESDWSFVQEWRHRPSGTLRNDMSPHTSTECNNPTINSPSYSKQLSSYHHLQNTPPTSSHISGRVHTPANLTQTHSQPLCTPETVVNIDLTTPSTQHNHNPQSLNSVNEKQCATETSDDGTIDMPDGVSQQRISSDTTNAVIQAKRVGVGAGGGSSIQHSGVVMEPERDLTPSKMSSIAHTSAVATLNRLPSSIPERVPASGPRPHHHLSVQELRLQQRVRECNSSSDDNRSSGHASMSDTGHSSPRGASQRSTRTGRTSAQAHGQRARHRATPAKFHAGGAPWGGGGEGCGLEDIRRAIQQLSLRSHTSTSSTHSSAGSDGSERPHATNTVHRLVRHSSLETINTNVTSADEFVWVDSHNRLVELQHLPWTQQCVQRVLRSGRCREHLHRISSEAIPRLSYLLQRALIRVGREIQRLAAPTGLCSKHEVASAFRIVLCPPLADSCIKACLRAATMFAVSGDCVLRQSKSSRAGLQLPVGRFHRWMADVRLGKFIHEYAAVYLCAGMENLLEEILMQCLPNDPEVNLTATILEHGIANNGDLWGLLQPYAHLNAGRIATGVLAMPRWASASSLGSGSGRDSGRGSGPSEPSLLTTCVGSLSELQELVARLRPRIPLSRAAIQTLFYFMRCSQLEHAEQGTPGTVQELCYERAYVVLPPLVEWLRVAAAFGEHRQANSLDRDDIMQAARLLLPGVDCPPRPILYPEEVGSTIELAFRFLLAGNIQQALALLPATTRLDTVNNNGYTGLMLAAIQDDAQIVAQLLDAGANPDIETPGPSENQHWTALTYAASLGHCRVARILLERGASVEGGARLSEERCTLTPLQVASGSGCLEMVSLLLSHGADAFLSTLQRDSMCYSGSAQRGCYTAISVAAAHGKRAILRRLVAQPPSPPRGDVLSLEEMLAEGSNNERTAEPSKPQLRALQEAMCHGTEADHLDVALELRALGVSWTLHCWMHALSVALQQRLDCVIDQLLQDFLQVCPDDYSSQFVQECLPLLFNIFRYSKKEGTILLLADIFCTCFGWEAIKPIHDPAPCPVSGSRIDPKFVNNPELSDVTFRVEGRVFYGHKIVLVTASPRLRAMLSSKLCEGSPPVVQINDIRYHIFQIVMQFLYQGGCQALEPAPGDILELMAAANFFQLDGLLRYCEARCAAMLDLDNVVSMYIHAKVYNAQQLLEYCQGFLLQNMVALLTYDDSVKRLLFSKKLPNHDVLAGLLATLQARIKARSSAKPTTTHIR